MAQHFQPKDHKHAAHKAEADRQGQHANEKPGRPIPVARQDDDLLERHPKSPRRKQ